MSFSDYPWVKIVEAKGHKLARDEDGVVNAFAYESGTCNGPECERCGKQWCWHCRSAEQVDPCTCAGRPTKN